MAIINLATILIEAAIAVAVYAEEVKATHVVVLGRDCWPLLPLLRELGVSCSYFIFSRLQVGDEGTEKQWLREVPPHSLVVDTGYRGSILDAIQVFDPSIKGVLLYSSGKYPAVGAMLNFKHSMVVAAIEKMPKIIGRGVSIDARGVVRCPQDTRDDDENLGGITPAQVVAMNLRLCHQLGISRSWASFTGTAPSTRVPMPLNEWYAYVQQKCETCVPFVPRPKAQENTLGSSFHTELCFNGQSAEVIWYGVPSGQKIQLLMLQALCEGAKTLSLTVFNAEGLEDSVRFYFRGKSVSVSLPLYADIAPLWGKVCKDLGFAIID